MVTPEEINKFVKEINVEDHALVNEALEECIKLHGRSMWSSASDAEKINSIWCWIAGWKKRDQALFSVGGSITIPTDVVESDKQMSDGGHILVTESQYNLLGAGFLRNINGTPHAEIIVISDDKYNDMKPSERVEYLNNAITDGVRM